MLEILPLHMLVFSDELYEVVCNANKLWTACNFEYKNIKHI